MANKWSCRTLYCLSLYLLRPCGQINDGRYLLKQRKTFRAGGKGNKGWSWPFLYFSTPLGTIVVMTVYQSSTKEDNAPGQTGSTMQREMTTLTRAEQVSQIVRGSWMNALHSQFMKQRYKLRADNGREYRQSITRWGRKDAVLESYLSPLSHETCDLPLIFL